MQRSRAGHALRPSGLTLIAFLAVLAVISILVVLAIPRYFPSVDRSKEVVLKESLTTVRNAIDRHYRDIGHYPASLQELVDEHYLRSLPIDPITESAATWRLIPPVDAAKGGVYDLRSGALGSTVDGTPYSNL